MTSIIEFYNKNNLSNFFPLINRRILLDNNICPELIEIIYSYLIPFIEFNDSNFILHIEASFYNEKIIKYICPFCNAGKKKKKNIHQHSHGIKNIDHNNSVEERSSHCNLIDTRVNIYI